MSARDERRAQAVVNFRRYLRRIDAELLHELVVVMSVELSTREDDFRRILGPTLAPLLLPEISKGDRETKEQNGTRNAS